MTMLEKMKSSVGKKVKIIDVEGNEYSGTVWFIEDADENPSNEYALILIRGKNDVDGFYESEIKSIEIIQS